MWPRGIYDTSSTFDHFLSSLASRARNLGGHVESLDLTLMLIYDM